MGNLKRDDLLFFRLETMRVFILIFSSDFQFYIFSEMSFNDLILGGKKMSTNYI